MKSKIYISAFFVLVGLVSMGMGIPMLWDWNSNEFNWFLANHFENEPWRVAYLGLLGMVFTGCGALFIILFSRNIWRRI